MVEAKEDVNKMKAELAIKNQELAAATKEAEALLKSISESTAIAEKGEEKAVAEGLHGEKLLNVTSYIARMAGHQPPE